MRTKVTGDCVSKLCFTTSAVYYQACRVLNDIQVIYHFFTTFGYLFELITKNRLLYNSLEFMN